MMLPSSFAFKSSGLGKKKHQKPVRDESVQFNSFSGAVKAKNRQPYVENTVPFLS